MKAKEQLKLGPTALIYKLCLAHDKGQSFLLKEKQNRKETTTNKVGGFLENFSSVFSSSLHTYLLCMYVQCTQVVVQCIDTGAQEMGGQGGPVFSISVNHISTRGDRLCPTHSTTCPPRFRQLPTPLIEIVRVFSGRKISRNLGLLLLSEMCTVFQVFLKMFKINFFMSEVVKAATISTVMQSADSNTLTSF